jgi:site-specific DNA recombinase
MVQGKRQVVSFKTKKRRVVDPEDWIVVENTHEPIVDRLVWDKVQERLNSNSRVKTTNKKKVGMFAGLLKCADCGSPLAYSVKRLQSCEKGIYRCSRYNNNGAKACSNHYIEEEVLSQFVLNDIRKYAQLAADEKEEIAAKLIASMKKNNSRETGTLRSKIRETEKRLEEIGIRLKNLYEDKCTGAIPENVFRGLMNDFSKEQELLEDKLPKLRSELSAFQETTDNINDWLDMISQYTELKTLTREIVFGLIDSITVSERKKIYDRQVQEIKIEYRFIKNLLET